MKKRGKDIAQFSSVLSILASGEKLPAKNRDHQLSGNLSDFRECHIDPDWLLLYRIDSGCLLLIATETGTHADLFGI